MTRVPTLPPDLVTSEIPDPQFGTLDASILSVALGEPHLEAARWASFAKSQQQVIAALREQVAALRARCAPTPVATPAPETLPATAGANGKRG